jgi:hypothetical protein
MRIMTYKKREPMKTGTSQQEEKSVFIYIKIMSFTLYTKNS